MFGPNWINPLSWDERPVRILIARLSSYRDTLHSSTHRLLYALLSSHPDIFPDLAFCPAEMPAQWVSLGAGRPAMDYDCVAVSNALVQELINLPALLRGSGIALGKSARIKDEKTPLVILGGANSLHSSLLWTDDPWVDGIFIGESLTEISRIFSRIADLKRDGAGKRDILSVLCEEVEGFFEPECVSRLRTPVRKARGGDDPIHELHAREPWMPDKVLAGTAPLHISEGCAFFCSFCAESYARKPYRELDAERVVQDAMRLKRDLGLETLDLFSFNFNQHAQIRRILRELLELFDRVGLKSQRFDGLAEDEEIIDLMRLAGKTSLTCGLEGISERMRRFLQKSLSERVLRRAIERILQMPLRELKVFLIVTGREEDSDFDEFKEWMNWFSVLVRRRPKGLRVVFSATPLVRFPWTPLEFDPAPNAEYVGRLMRRVKALVINAGLEFREAASAWESQVSQILVRARDPRVSDALRVAQERSEFLYSDAVGESFARVLEEELVKRGLSVEQCLAAPQSEEETPWRMISPGISRDFLRALYRKCLDDEHHVICLGNERASGRCGSCEACFPEERKAITAKRPAGERNDASWEKRVVALRRAERTLEIPVVLHVNCLGWSVKSWTAWLARGVMCASADMTLHVRGLAKSFWEERLDQELCRIAGKERLRVILTARGSEILEQRLTDAQFRIALEEQWRPWFALDNAADIPGRELTCQTEICSPEDWFRAKGLKATLRRDGMRYIWQFSKDSLKKRFISEMEASKEDSGLWKLRIVPGDKFDAVEFTRIALGGLSRWPLWAAL